MWVFCGFLYLTSSLTVYNSSMRYNCKPISVGASNISESMTGPEKASTVEEGKCGNLVNKTKCDPMYWERKLYIRKDSYPTTKKLPNNAF